MNSFSERLRDALDYKGISQAELSRRTGIGRNSISDYLKGKYEAKQDNVYLLASALEVNEAWLMGLDVKREKSSDQQKLIAIFSQLDDTRKSRVVRYADRQLNEQQRPSHDNGELIKLPAKIINAEFSKQDDRVIEEELAVYGYLSAGNGQHNFDKENPIAVVTLPKSQVPAGTDMVFMVSGDSMEPLFENGEYVFVQETTDVVSGQVVAVEINEEAFVKKMYLEDDRMRLVSLNTDIDSKGNRLYPDFYADEKDDLYLLGRVLI